MIRLSKPPEQN